MGARYSDRFFGPDAGTSGLPSGRETIGREPIHPDVLPGADPPHDLERSTPEPQRPSYRLPAAAAAVSLLVGAVGGAAGWEQWRDHQADAQARTAVEVTAVASISGVQPDRTAVSVTVRLRNDGPYRLTLTGVSPLDIRLLPRREAFESVPIEPGEESVETVHFDLACDAPGQTSAGGIEEPVLAELSTIDGHAEDLPLQGNAYGGSFGSFVSEICASATYDPSFRDIYLEMLDAEPSGTDQVLAQVALYGDGIGADEAPEVLAVSPASAAFTATWDPALNSEPLTGVRQIAIAWSVNDCEQALVADEREMSLDVNGRTDPRTTPTTTRVAPSPGLAAELVRLTQRVCG